MPFPPAATSFYFSEFTSQPQDKVTGRNLPLLITCTANTTLPGTLLILWKFNSTWIVDYHSKHFKQEANGSLYFQQFLASDQGFYQCSALVQDSNKNHIGQIYSRNATIKLACMYIDLISKISKSWGSWPYYE